MITAHCAHFKHVSHILRKDYISEMPSATSRGEVENAKLFCPDLTQAVLDRIDEDEESSLNVNKAQNIVAGSLERSLMTLFLHHYGWSQVYNWSWNPMKIAQNWRAWHSGMRLVYDTNMAALLRSKLCHEHLQGILCWNTTINSNKRPSLPDLIS